MSAKLNANSRRGTGTANVSEIFSPQKDLPPTNTYLTEISDNEGDYCVMQCALPAGAIVPLHSHADRETFYVLSGTPSSLREDTWTELGPGDIVDVQDGARHAWKNASQEPASMLCVTTMKMAKFLRDISASSNDVSNPDEQAQRFLNLVMAHGYWLANPEENAAVGLDVNWSGSHG
ncbi:cupin domain-containing protein [Bradyrhizobium sp. SYSU BS000235]|uniref:cupin domain-containing protein n=1 Tax=Bradyrhizobium sp. SYSU BS000235 TaxID=3411332 RepID=UPI003C764794